MNTPQRTDSRGKQLLSPLEVLRLLTTSAEDRPIFDDFEEVPHWTDLPAKDMKESPSPQ